MEAAEVVPFDAGGEMASRIVDYDWSRTSAGPLPTWSASRMTVVRLLLQSRFPMFLWLGDDLVGVYNDAYGSLVGHKHPAALGRPAAEVWSEIWDVVGPLTSQILSGGPGTWSEDLQLIMERSGFMEETYFTFAYSPFTDEGRVAGVFAAVTETTERVVGNRRLLALRRLSESLAELRTESDILAAATATLEEHHDDICAAAVYLTDEREARLCAATTTAHQFADAVSFADWDELMASGATSVDWATLVSRGLCSAEPRADSSRERDARFVVEPLRQEGSAQPYGGVVVELNGRRPLDEDYRSFISVAVGLIGGALVNARAYEGELRRSQALTAIDQAKTAFFQNVSHEFRTPLTLMLGPLDDALRDRDEVLGEHQRERITVAARNGRRMKRLVESLLSIARAESEQYDAAFSPADLPVLTAELVSVFESAYRQAEIELVSEMRTLSGPVWVDRWAWESIVFNLLSNALKYTNDGRVTVRVLERDRRAVLEVVDTGVGIPEDELPRVFDRFFRARSTGGRSAEGAGVGLAVVRSMTQLHGGEVTVASTVGVGSTFTVSVPIGNTHLPVSRQRPEPVAPTRAEGLGESYVVEAERWLRVPVPPSPLGIAEGGAILVVDDNADMRSYLQQILSPHWPVLVAGDGQTALELARTTHPRLVLADVMMPAMDGVELTNAIRNDPALQGLEVILLSARAGAEASLGGLEAGADDYVTKPFTADELVRRIRARMGRIEAREAAQQHDIASRVAQAAAAARTVDDLVEAIHRPLKELSAVAVVVGVWDREDQVMRIFDGETLPRRYRDRYRLLSSSVPHPMVALLGTGEVAVFEEPESLLAAGYPDIAKDARDAGYVTTAVLPMLSADGSGLGAVGICWDRRHRADELRSLLDGIARVAARNLERVTILEQQRRVAESLHEELLATSSSSDLAAITMHYVPADDALLVGGDWYDAVDLLDGALAVGVGDVVGSGLPAIRTMSQLRTALATAALAGPDVGTTMQNLDHFADRAIGAAWATAAFGVLHPNGTFAYSVAGHPPPLVVHADGSTEYLWEGRSRPLAGGKPDVARPVATTALPPGATLVLYTDGLIERRGEPLDVSLQTLREIVTPIGHLPTPLLRDRLVGSLNAGRARRDDAVLVLVRPVGASERQLTYVLRAEAEQVRAARHTVQAWLRQFSIDSERADGFVVAVNEAITNAVDHGSRRPSDVVTIEAAIDGTRLLVCVSDRGQWSSDTRATGALGRGRGLALMHLLCDRVETSIARSGSTCTVELDLAGSAQ
jgi:signal transduction histidine kinase/CheY-like chemotaxis protein